MSRRSTTDGINVPKINEKTLRPIIYNNMKQIQQGECFLEYELTEDCFDKLLTDEETYGKFEKMISSIWYNMDDKAGLNDGKQKKMKYLTAVQNGASFIKSEIEAYQQNFTREEKYVADPDISSLSTDNASRRDSSTNPYEDVDELKEKNLKDRNKRSKKRKRQIIEEERESACLNKRLRYLEDAVISLKNDLEAKKSNEKNTIMMTIVAGLMLAATEFWKMSGTGTGSSCSSCVNEFSWP